jgi:acetylornithine deacetylase
MVEIDSVNSAVSGRPAAEGPLIEFLQARARVAGLQTRRLPVPAGADNLLIMCEKRDDAPWLLFESHVDTVGTVGMSADTQRGQVIRGRIHGRGACDAKGSAAAMFCSLTTYASERIGGHNVALLFSVDEETSKTGIKAFVDAHLGNLGWRPVGAIVGEPTSLRLVVAHNGTVRWSIRTDGIAAHSSDPALGRSAITKMVDVIETLETRYIGPLDRRHPLTGKAACSINVIHGGSEVNRIPDSCEIRLDRRTVPGENGLEVLADIERLLAEMRAADRELVVSIRDPWIDPPLEPRRDDSFARQVAAEMAVLGLSGASTGVQFGTNASTLADAGIPAVVLGPGDIAQAHGPDEWIEVTELDRAVDVYSALMRAPSA